MLHELGGIRWFYTASDGSAFDVSEGLLELLRWDVPHDAWPSIWPAMVLSDEGLLFQQEVDARVRDGDGGWWPTGPLARAPVTDVEQTLRGQLSTLQAVLWNYGDLYCVTQALLGITFKLARIDAYREGYVEGAVDDQGQDYRRVVWPTLQLSPGPATWSPDEPQQMDRRNHELLYTAVFSVE